jgi:lipid-binding SYLF domain-containing protein
VFSAKKLAASTAILCSFLIGPALAAGSNDANTKAASTAQSLVDQSASTIQTLRGNKDFSDLLQKAKGVLIVPNLVKGAAVIGGSGGSGILVVRHDGRWSDPAFFTLGSISVGAQAGGKAGPVAMFLMTDKAVADLTQNDNFSLNGNASLTIVKWSPSSRGSIGKGDIVLWSGAKGLFAGLDVSGSEIVADTKEDQAFYKNGHVGTKQIIENDVTSARAQKLRNALPS